jgi:hypothetical protein
VRTCHSSRFVFDVTRVDRELEVKSADDGVDDGFNPMLG